MILYIITALAIGGLAILSHFQPHLAPPAAGFASALLVNLGRRTTFKNADILGALLSGAIVLFDRFNWVSLVFLPSLVIGCAWLRLPQKKLGSDDRIYLPALSFACVTLILCGLRSLLLRTAGDISSLTGFATVSTWMAQTLEDGASQLSGETQKDFLALVANLKEVFPYYYIGGQIISFTFMMNFVMRLQRMRSEPVRPLIFFKIKEPYVFLLIFAMGAEIFRYLLERKELLYISRPLFVFLGTTYFLAGLAVVGFMIISSRARPKTLLSRWFVIFLVMILLMKPIVGAAIGLLDIWFDFRKLKLIKEGDIT